MPIFRIKSVKIYTGQKNFSDNYQVWILYHFIFIFIYLIVHMLHTGGEGGQQGRKHRGRQVGKGESRKKRKGRQEEKEKGRQYFMALRTKLLKC